MAITIGSNSYVTSGLQCYLDASVTSSYSGSGTAWNDISGNGKNFTWLSTPTFVSAGTASYFLTLNNRCTGPASNSFGITNITGYTIILVRATRTLSSSGAFKFYSSNGTGSTGRGIFAHCTWADNTTYFDQGGCCNSDTRTSVTDANDQFNFVHYAFRASANNGTRYISSNGVTIATNATTAAAINLSATAVDLGSTDEYGGNSSAWDAKLRAFMVYNRALTDAEVLQNYVYLSNGISYGDNSVQQFAPSSVDHGTLISVNTYTATGTYTVPNNCNSLFVKLVGGGGGSAGYCESGGAGGYSEVLINPAPSGGSNVAVTIGGGGGGVGYYAAAGAGGTTSFGSYCSATGGYGANQNYSHTGGGGGVGSGGSVNLMGGGGTGHANGHSHGAVAKGGASFLGGASGYNRSTNNSKVNVGAPGAGSPGGRTDDGSTGVAGESGLVIVYAYT
jgi:hypothetical protein